MSAATADAENDTAVETPAKASPARSKPAPKADTKPKRQPPYAVILHNDDVNGMDFVVETIIKVFGYAPAKALRLTIQAHFAGRACVWTGHRELAELKAEQLLSRGPDPIMARFGASPLGVSVEPFPE